MWKPVANLVFHVVLIVVLALALYASLDWPRETALFPQAVGVPVLALTMISFGLEFYRVRRERLQTAPAAAASESDGEDSVFFAKATASFGWLIGFGVAIWLLGFYLAALAYLFLYVRLQAKMTVAASAFAAIAAVAVVYGFFSLLLHIEPYHGLVEDLIGL